MYIIASPNTNTREELPCRPAVGHAFLTACDTSQQPLPPPVSKTVTDALGRSISVPGQVSNVITMRAGALRLMLYR